MGSDGGAGGVIGGGIGGIGRGAECLGALRVDKPADRGALEHETAALRRRCRTRTVGAMKVERGGEREADRDTS
jgi:hypothetical protein